MSDKPLVSAVIPAFDAERFVGGAVESVLKQTYEPIECVVVDDGSTDRTPEVVADFSDVRLVRQENGGPARARNAAIDHARGAYVAFLDADDVWVPEKTERQMEHLIRDEDVALVYAGFDVVDERLRFVRRVRPAPVSEALTRTLLLEKPYMTAIGSSAIVRTDVARQIRFDPRLPPSEDWGFACEVALRHLIAVVPESLVLYRQHPLQGHLDRRPIAHATAIKYDEWFGQDLLPEALRNKRRRGEANLNISLAYASLKRGDRKGFLRHLGRVIALRPDRIPAALLAHLRFGR